MPMTVRILIPISPSPRTARRYAGQQDPPAGLGALPLTGGGTGDTSLMSELTQFPPLVRKQNAGAAWFPRSREQPESQCLPGLRQHEACTDCVRGALGPARPAVWESREEVATSPTSLTSPTSS